MRNIKKNIPELLIYSRVISAWIILISAILRPQGTETMICILLISGLLTDIFDGIIARHLNISTTHLRQLDSKTDRLFWITSAFAIMLLHPGFLLEHWLGLSILFILEFGTLLVGKIKFRNAISFHPILSKFWAISILTTLLDLLFDGNADISFSVTFWYGLLAQADVLLIIFILPAFQCDIPSAWHAFMIRKGRPIRKLKLFNG